VVQMVLQLHLPPQLLHQIVLLQLGLEQHLGRGEVEGEVGLSSVHWDVERTNNNETMSGAVQVGWSRVAATLPSCFPVAVVPSTLSDQGEEQYLSQSNAPK